MHTRERPALAILGTRGIPASYGGFETFAERLAIHLVERGWDVEVYCHDDAGRNDLRNDLEPLTEYAGVRLRRVPVRQSGPLGTMVFDWRAMRQATSGPPRLLLSLGYNCAVFFALARLLNRTNVVNMDGLEWQRRKWSPPLRAWLWCNERLACWFADHLIADHPAIADHLATRTARERITTIPYGADAIAGCDTAHLERLGLSAGGYALMVGRPVPENSIIELVRAFSRRPRGMQLVVLGQIHPDAGPYARAILEAASPEVMFLGAIYDQTVLGALRHHCHVYLHGHQIGGTNPSLVEALGAGNMILAHDNRFNRWVAGADAAYFVDEDDCARQLDHLLSASGTEVQTMRAGSLRRHAAQFTWTSILASYETFLLHWWTRTANRRSRFTRADQTVAGIDDPSVPGRLAMPGASVPNGPAWGEDATVAAHQAGGSYHQP